MENYRDWIRTRKRTYLLQALAYADGSATQAAKLISVNRTYFNKLVIDLALRDQAKPYWFGRGKPHFDSTSYREYVAGCKRVYMAELNALTSSPTKAARLSGLSRQYVSKLAPSGRKLKRGNWGALCDKHGRDVETAHA